MKKLKDFIYKMPFNTTIFFCLLMLYYELIFHKHFFDMSDGNISHIVLFAIIIGMGCSLFLNLFPRTINKIIAVVLVVFWSVYFIAQIIYHEVFDNFLSLSGTIRYGNQAADNYATVLRNLKENLLVCILMLLPVAVVILCVRYVFSFERRKWWVSLIILICTVYCYFMAGQLLQSDDRSLYNPYKIYKEYTSVDMAVEKLGASEALIVDIREGIKTAAGVNDDELVFEVVTPTYQAEEKTEEATEEAYDEITEEEPEEVLDTSPNIIDIDFDELNANAENDNIIALNNYFSSLTGTNKNEYTGMFEGYNLIWITAEGFSGYLLDTGLFPTLEELANTGFVFENYYSPLWYGSTIGGEYANLLGSMPKNGGYLSLSYAGKQGNDLTFAMGNQLKRLGYTVMGFHNNSATYYDRNISHLALGYEWIANGTGLEAQTNDSGNTLWPQSDLVMIQDTFDLYSSCEPFHVYYMTVSGHVEYNFSGNAMAAKNKEIVEELPYSDTTKAYIACQYELELAMEQLITYLKENDLYDHTVIVLAGDHVPYNNMEVLSDIAGYELEDTFEAYKSSLIIWSGDMEQPIKVSKVCSSIDILPTVSNLFGLEYDSRLIIGQDALSDSQGLVMFANRSFITDDYSYNASNGVVTSFSGAEITDEELADMKAFVANKFTAADSITEYDYYSYIEPYRKAGK